MRVDIEVKRRRMIRRKKVSLVSVPKKRDINKLDSEKGNVVS